MMIKMNRESLLYIFPQPLRSLWNKAVEQYRDLEEIRIRAGKPVIVKLHEKETFLDGMEKRRLIRWEAANCRIS